MNLNQSIFIDSMIFYAVNIYIILWVIRKNITIREKLAYILFFIILNSSYNIMIKPIHDYNISIPRNFIWNYDLIGPLAIADIIFLLLFILNIIDFMKIIKYSKFTALIFAREIIFIVIGVVSFFINSGYQINGFGRFTIELKSVLYFFASMMITIKYMNRSIEEVNYMKIITLILVSGFVSLLFFDDYYLWIRYGQVVKIIDQEDAGTISIIAIYYFLFRYLKNRNKMDIIIFLALIVQNLLCMYKNTMIILLGSVVIIILYMKKNLKNYFVGTLLILSIMLIGIVKYESIGEILSSQSMITRVYQSTDFINEMENKGSYAMTFGLGMGTPYKSTFNIGDEGEIKIIDKINNVNGYREIVQVPIIGMLKYVGIAGFIIVTIFTIKIMVLWLKYIIKNKYNLSCEFKSLSISFILSIILATCGYSIGGESSVNVFYGFIISRLAMEMKKNK